MGPAEFLSFWFSDCDGVVSIGHRDIGFAFVNLSSEDPIISIFEQSEGQNDFYFRLCPMKDVPGKGRGKADDALMVPGFWLDVDCGEKNNGKSYFPNKTAAVEWVRDTFGRWLSAIVDSGNGIHAYFKFDEPVEYSETIALRSKHFQHWAAELCPFDIDITSDLARVLRVPGSKNGERTVQVIFMDEGKRSGLSDIVDMLPGDVSIDDVKPHVKCSIKLEADGDLKYSIMLLCKQNPTFDKLWTRRYDYGLKDSSPSGYCMAIANKLVQYEYSHEQISGAIAWWREENGADPKPPGWYQLTINKAMTQKGLSRAKSEVKQEMSDIEDTINAISATGGDGACLAALSEMFGSAVSRVVERRPPVSKGSDRKKTAYVFYFSDHDGVVSVSDSDLLKVNTVIRMVMRETRKMPPLNSLSAKAKATAWARAIDMILAAAEIEEGYAPSTSTLMVKDLVESFLETFTTNRKPAENPNAMKDNMVCFCEGRLAFKLKGLSDYLNEEGIKISRDDLLDCMRDLGVDYQRYTRTRVWVLPEQWSSEISASLI